MKARLMTSFIRLIFPWWLPQGLAQYLLNKATINFPMRYTFVLYNCIPKGKQEKIKKALMFYLACKALLLITV